MKDSKARAVAAVVAMALVAVGFLSSAALGASKLTLRFVAGHQPTDAEVGDTIKAANLDDAAGFVQVELVDADGNRVASSKGPVSFSLQTGAGYATGELHVDPQPLIDGLATFGEGTLWIGTENEPQFTDFAIVPFTTKGTFITSEGPSQGFDIWEDGEACSADGPACHASLRGGNDLYTLDGATGSLGASELFGALPGLSCEGQDTIFEGTIFSYATSEADGNANEPVFLSNHITREDWLASANNGQAHAEWCIGLPTAAPWIANGANYVQQDTNFDGTLDLYVALAPRCPVMNPSAFAPCIVSQTGDGMGGSTSIGWLTGGDPPRRT